MQKSAFWVLVASLVGCGSSAANTVEPAAEHPTEEPSTERPVVVPLGSTYDDVTARACSAPSDCTLVEGLCEHWMGVRTTHVGIARAYWITQAAAVECGERPTVPPTQATCSENLCAPDELDHAEWRACSTAADCVAVHDVCGGVDAVNRASEAVMLADVQQRAMRVRCMSTTEGPLPTPVCRGSFCVAY
jgi:hypothetical protein